MQDFVTNLTLMDSKTANDSSLDFLPTSSKHTPQTFPFVNSNLFTHDYMSFLAHVTTI